VSPYRRLDRLPEKVTATDLERDLNLHRPGGHDRSGASRSGPAIARARRAGIRTVMITGDYRETARAIAAEIGLLRADGQVHTGAEIDKMDDAALIDAVEETDVFARVSRSTKCASSRHSRLGSTWWR